MEDYGFRFLDHMEQPAIELIAVGKQSRGSREYDWDNSHRPAAFLFQYTLGGSGSLWTGGQTYRVGEGEAFFLQLPDNERYYFDESCNCAPWRFIYVMFSGNHVLPYYRYITGRGGKLFSLPKFHPAIAALLDLYAAAREGLIQNAFMASSEVFRFLCLLCASGGQAARGQPGLIGRAQAYLQENFARPVTLAETAEQLGVSQSHLSREFLKYTGEQPVHYLTKLRLEAAAGLLNSTGKTLAEIGRSCGFSDSNYFGKVFKRYMKISPGEFRRQVQAQGYSHVKI